ncbi:MFS transporter [Lederbergia galactosidilytica]|uniref:Multidrug transporter n=1 Tax=Lederbergia galactosidilytica TaxID=217031 RepID=A0A177ZMW2_9BACI|nr:MFS transporter [Lederbergia galactosidilytica]KRG14906.1 multidrug transporter [Virgibacillus soli]OAK69155.1 multidrug transporter [Lederbergia galactosidilytica]
MRVLVYFIVFFSFFDLFSQLPIMSPLATSLGAPPFLVGLVVGMFSLSNIIGNVTSGFLTDKKGPLSILIFGLFSTSIFLLLYYFATDTWILLLVRFIHGFTAGLIVPAAFTNLANTTANEKKGKGAALSGAFIGLAAIIGPAFSGIVASKVNEITVFAVTSFFMFSLGILSLIFLRSLQKVKKPKLDQKAISVKVFFQDPYIMKAYLGALFLMFSQGVVAYMLPLKVLELGSDTQTSGLLMSTFGLVAVLIFILPTNTLFDRLKAVHTAVFGMLLMGISMLSISFSPSIHLLYFIMGVYGIGFAFLFPSLNSMLVEATDPADRGKAYGYFYAFFSMGVVIGSGVTGLLQLTANGGFLFAGTLLIIGAFFMFFKNRTVHTPI